MTGNGAATSAAVELRGITKSFGAVVALRGVDLVVAPGEVVGIVGDNGAGKSTLMKIISGAIEPDRGEMFIRGEPVQLSGPWDSRRRGIEMVYQDLALCDDLDVANNFFLGREPKRFGLLKGRKMHEEARRDLQSLGISIHSTATPIRALSGGQRQAVAIGRAVSFEPKLLILDEPTAALGVKEAGLVLSLIKQVSSREVGIILISHRLQDVLEVCDRVVLIANGRNSKELDVKKTSMEDLVGNIVGVRVEEES